MSKVTDTGLKRLWSGHSTSSAIFIPMTGPMNAAQVNQVRMSRYLESGSGNLTVRGAYNMSRDGYTWSSTVTSIGSFATDAGWKYNSGTETTISANQRMFVRFGLEVKNATGDAVERGMGRLRIECTPTGSQTLNPKPDQVWSDGSTNYIFHPLTKPLPIQGIDEIRASVECEGDSGDTKIRAAYQVSDDGLSWDSGATSAAEDSLTAFGTAQAGDGKTYGTTFASFAPTKKKQWVRFGVACKNNTGAGKVETCLATLRVDTRQST